MKITYERFDFAQGVVEQRTREIVSKNVLEGNALFQRLVRRSDNELIGFYAQLTEDQKRAALEYDGEDC